jgi:predicted RNA-binding Zn-ribbon protein involved in translation (DUF1610 family)
MSWIKGPWPFFLLAFLGFWVMVFSIWGVIFDKGWINVITALYVILIVLLVFVIFIRSLKTAETIDMLKEFEKTVEGGLHHFKCPTCNGIFAVKKSRKNNQKHVKMTCPDCGAIGIISPTPEHVEEEIPEKKSIKANFKCNICGEGITIWAEGTKLYQNTHIYSCPYCGEEETMERI